MTTMVTFAYIILGFFAFFIGGSIFSFLNVIVYRMPRKISFLKGRSFCTGCQHSLSMLDMIPVFGYVLLKGRCRYCHQRISIRYPLVEAFGGLLAVCTVVQFGFTGKGVCVFVLLCILTVISLIDWDIMEIYDRMNLLVLVIGCISAFFFPEISLMERIVGFFSVSLPMLILTLIIPDAFGGGDIKLMAGCGVFLGWKNNLTALFLAILMGGIYGSWLLLQKKKDRKDHFAFGPFLCVGVAASIFIGTALRNWYFGCLFWM